MNPFYNDGSYRSTKAAEVVTGPPVVLIGTWAVLIVAQLVLSFIA